MRLPDKRTVQTVMAGQRKSQIDEGVAIAKKVDALRETYSSLQTQQQLFIDSMSTALTKRTEELNEEIANKERVVLDLEQKRMKLLEPLTLKWDEVEKEKEELESLRKELKAKDKELYDIQNELEEKRKEIYLDEERVEDLKKQVNIQVDKVYDSSLQAQNTLLNALDKETQVNTQLEAKRKAIEGKEQEVLIRERNITLKEENINRQEQEIIKTKLMLADQRATLDRAFARLK